MNKELVDYFISQTNDRFKTLESKVDEVLRFKWTIIGSSVVLSFVITLSLQLIMR